MFASTLARSTRPFLYASTRQVIASTSSCAPSCSFSTTCNSLASSASSSSGRPPPPPPSSSSDSHLTPSAAELKKVEQRNTTPPPYLSRALGVANKPSTDPVTREEWKRNLLSKERRLNERKHLVKQVSKGYFNDYNELRHQGGKKWIAPNTLIRQDVRPQYIQQIIIKTRGLNSSVPNSCLFTAQLSLYFPDIQGVSLANKAKTHTTDLWKGKVSLVAMGSFKSSEEHVDSFVRPALSDMKDEPLFQYVYINAQENALKSFLVTMFLSSLRRQILPQHQPTYLLSHQSLEYVREPLGMTNKHVGYVYLVDWNGKVRWAGCGWATLNEEEALRKCCHVLVERLRKDHHGAAVEGGEAENS